MTAPFVVGTMALFVGYEQIQDDVAKVYSRLAANQVSGALCGFPANPLTVNQLVDIGWNNPNKDRNTPYRDALPFLTLLNAPHTSKYCNARWE